MTINEVNEKIKQKRNELSKLYNLKCSMQRTKSRKENSYEKAAKLAERINAFHFCKDLKKKTKLFFKDTIYITKKSRHEIYTYDEMIKIINNVKDILNKYKGEILFDESILEFMVKYYKIISDNGIKGVLYMCDELKFSPYTGKYNYISKLYEDL